MKDLETRYLERLSDLYPTIAAASTEIINLQSILNLPDYRFLLIEIFFSPVAVGRHEYNDLHALGYKLSCQLKMPVTFQSGMVI